MLHSHTYFVSHSRTHDFLTLKWSLFSSSLFTSVSPDLFLDFKTTSFYQRQLAKGIVPGGKPKGNSLSTLKRKSCKWPEHENLQMYINAGNLAKKRNCFQLIWLAVITVISGLTCKRKGQFCFVLTRSPRLHAFWNKRIFDRKRNCNNSNYQIIMHVFSEIHSCLVVPGFLGKKWLPRGDVYIAFWILKSSCL